MCMDPLHVCDPLQGRPSNWDYWHISTSRQEIRTHASSNPNSNGGSSRTTCATSSSGLTRLRRSRAHRAPSPAISGSWRSPSRNTETSCCRWRAARPSCSPSTCAASASWRQAARRRSSSPSSSGPWTSAGTRRARKPRSGRGSSRSRSCSARTSTRPYTTCYSGWRASRLRYAYVNLSTWEQTKIYSWSNTINSR